jgi:hypothetical protein
MKITFFTLLLGAFSISTVASAQSLITPPAFVPTAMYFSTSANFTVRVFGGATLNSYCPLGWAYVNEADDGAKEKIAGLMSAYAMGKTLNLIIQVTPGTNYCQIIEFLVSG